MIRISLIRAWNIIRDFIASTVKAGDYIWSRSDWLGLLRAKVFRGFFFFIFLFRNGRHWWLGFIWLKFSYIRLNLVPLFFQDSIGYFRLCFAGGDLIDNLSLFIRWSRFTWGFSELRTMFVGNNPTGAMFRLFVSIKTWFASTLSFGWFSMWFLISTWTFRVVFWACL